MIKVVGRILARRNKVAGLFIPMESGLPSGLYEIREVLGELTIVSLGPPAMPDPAYQGRSVGELLNVPQAGMTPAEWAEVCQTPT